MVTRKCLYCQVKFSPCSYEVKRGNALFCSKKCQGKHSNGYKKQEVKCIHCGRQFFKSFKEIKRTKNNFCSRSCSAKHGNANKKYETNVSKLEIYLQHELRQMFHHLEFIFNGKEAIKGELDIYIPSLKLAFELNGLFHYEPIFGDDKLERIQNNDQRKFQACFERGIELCIIDTSSQKYFKPERSKKYLNIIESIISKKLQ